MKRLATLLSAAALLSGGAAMARAEHAKVELTATAGDRQVTAYVDQTPPAIGKTPRPMPRTFRRWAKTNIISASTKPGESLKTA